MRVLRYIGSVVWLLFTPLWVVMHVVHRAARRHCTLYAPKAEYLYYVVAVALMGASNRVFIGFLDSVSPYGHVIETLVVGVLAMYVLHFGRNHGWGCPLAWRLEECVWTLRHPVRFLHGEESWHGAVHGDLVRS